jgi:MATE family multidrug resistance protein
MQVVMGGVLRGSGRQYIGAVVNFIAYYVIGIPIGAVLGLKTNLGVIGLWSGMAIGNALQVSKQLQLLFQEW